MKSHIRWGIRRDMPALLATEAFTADPWTEEFFNHYLASSNHIVMVAEGAEDGEPVGHVVFELHRGRIVITRLVVQPDHRAKGVGTQLMRKMLAKTSGVGGGGRPRLALTVPAGDVGMQRWVAGFGFNATGEVEGGVRFVYMRDINPAYITPEVKVAPF